ncbi:thioredoxin domain-containing protein [Lutibacter sp. A80]|uniref:thioredoxin family protein n=1 Tax=Lutibacter sp. A80 TaxID=2918453 RepID=UPI001F053C0B|nr:thioredoxin domain-containing protein [Lutibacter sp. A80]UMB59569.1 thioredoxin domain-containing protein [Lutibacter sp. A80]
MKRILVLVFFVSLSFISCAQEKRINFEKGTFKEALAKAVKEDKLIFMDCYTTWCRPCKEISKYVFTQEPIYTFFNKNFINIKIDVEKGEGIEIAKHYGVKSYPTLLVLNQKGEILSDFEDLRTAKDLLEKAKEILKFKSNTTSSK